MLVGQGPANRKPLPTRTRRGLLATFAGLPLVATPAAVAARGPTPSPACHVDPLRAVLPVARARPGLVASRSDRPVSDEATTYVLIHGGWHGGWCWNRVAPGLAKAGHRVLAPSLTGLADRRHLLTRQTGLDTHVQDIVGLLEYEDLRDVVLVGHSYAGMVITAVAAGVPQRVAHLVYLDAFVPEAGQTLLDLLPPDRVAFYREQAAGRGEGWRVPPPPVAALGVTDPADIAWLEAKLTDQPLRSFEQPLAGEPPAALRRTFIRCTEGPVAPSFAPFAAMADAAPAWDYHELAVGHDAMVIAPGSVVDVLAARTTRRENR